MSSSSSAMQYYTSGMNAYINQDYETALKWFEKAVQLDASLESYDELLKLRMGFSAYCIGDFDRAKTYLSHYKDNPVAQKLYQLMESASQPSEEWMKWIRSRIPQNPAPAEDQRPQRSKPPVFLLISVFISTFTGSLLLVIMIQKRRSFAHKTSMKQEESKEIINEISASEEDSNRILEANIDTLEKIIQDIKLDAESEPPSDETKDSVESEEAKKAEKIVEEILSSEEKQQEIQETTTASADPHEVLELLEEKKSYNKEDAEALSNAVQEILSFQEDSEEESHEKES
ncbi:MAG: hypothetical protein DRP33_07570 [Thermotogae bacterium]|nr:MAG: hypothetical protein DRP33_07570 [Thermotogota bacterium]